MALAVQCCVRQKNWLKGNQLKLGSRELVALHACVWPSFTCPQNILQIFICADCAYSLALLLLFPYATNIQGACDLEFQSLLDKFGIFYSLNLKWRMPKKNRINNTSIIHHFTWYNFGTRETEHTVSASICCCFSMVFRMLRSKIFAFADWILSNDWFSADCSKHTENVKQRVRHSFGAVHRRFILPLFIYIYLWDDLMMYILMSPVCVFVLHVFLLLSLTLFLHSCFVFCREWTTKKMPISIRFFFTVIQLNIKIFLFSNAKMHLGKMEKPEEMKTKTTRTKIAAYSESL